MNKYVLTCAPMWLVMVLLIACQGPQGPAGPQGPTGQGCTVSTLNAGSLGAPNGGALVSCANGTQAMILNGTNGTNGTNGSIITPVQFCTNSVTTYPSTFAEVGFCINGTLYAVYSANGGFETQVVSGEYGSDGINASCDFSVSGCNVTDN
jgi:hypothetical protein